MNELSARLARNEILILDGAIGTEIERLGVRMDNAAWCGLANRNQPEVVRKMHDAYLDAGADIITANTYATAPHVLEICGLRDEAAAITRRAVEIAKQARDAVTDRPVYVAGSISQMPGLCQLGGHTQDDAVPGYEAEFMGHTPRGEAAKASYREHAEALAEAGVDVIVTEMMIDVENATIVTEAALATGLPVWHGFSAEFAADGKTVVEWRGDEFTAMEPGPLDELIAAIVPMGGEVAGIMHSLPSVTFPALEILREHWSGPMSAYSETGKFENPKWNYTDTTKPDDYAAMALKWIELGVQVVGGCCGTVPDHIKALKAALPPVLPKAA
jgi:homocysteine S-methyltransferase